MYVLWENTPLAGVEYVYVLCIYEKQQDRRRLFRQIDFDLLRLLIKDEF